MKIYTRIGDEGDTARPGGEKVRKSDAICHALGGIDEINAVLGWCIAESQASGAIAVLDALRPLQGELLSLGAIVAAAGIAGPPPTELRQDSITRMERQIDEAMGQLPPLTHFIVPGGGELSCRLHIARTVCRRAERAIVQVADEGLAIDAVALKCINRLSDLLFALARLAAHLTGQAETVWAPRRES